MLRTETERRPRIRGKARANLATGEPLLLAQFREFYRECLSSKREVETAGRVVEVMDPATTAAGQEGGSPAPESGLEETVEVGPREAVVAEQGAEITPAEIRRRLLDIIERQALQPVSSQAARAGAYEEHLFSSSPRCHIRPRERCGCLRSG